jgi:hypothetical protein
MDLLANAWESLLKNDHPHFFLAELTVLQFLSAVLSSFAFVVGLFGSHNINREMDEHYCVWGQIDYYSLDVL